MANKSVLIISDTHFPYQHPETLDFLKAIKKQYKPDRVIHIGDEVDYHAISFHPTDPNLFSPSDELRNAIEGLKPLYKLFPKMDLIESNHGSLVYRKLKAHGLPLSIARDYRDILQAPKGWEWHNDLVITLSDKRKCYFHHGKSSQPSKLSQNMGMSSVQGHYHSHFAINYWANPNDIYFDMKVGCLIDDESMAFAYNKTTLARPILGCGIILDGQPVLLPMVLNKRGEWIGKLV